jgi:hypothetical protein
MLAEPGVVDFVGQSTFDFPTIVEPGGALTTARDGAARSGF